MSQYSQSDHYRQAHVVDPSRTRARKALQTSRSPLPQPAPQAPVFAPRRSHSPSVARGCTPRLLMQSVSAPARVHVHQHTAGYATPASQTNRHVNAIQSADKQRPVLHDRSHDRDHSESHSTRRPKRLIHRIASSAAPSTTATHRLLAPGSVSVTALSHCSSRARRTL